MSWKLFALASEYAQGLDLHSLDKENEHGHTHIVKSDDDRRGFWELVQLDLYFRLILNKPPAITGTTWQVNLPWLNNNSDP